jgi:hypothetical protein
MKLLFKHLLISLAACLFSTVFCMLKFSSYDGIPGTLFVVIMLAHFGILIAAVLVVILRFSGFTRPHKFIYIFMGTANCWMGALSFIIWLAGHARFVIVETFLPNLVIGIAMLADTFFFASKTRHAA